MRDPPEARAPWRRLGRVRPTGSPGRVSMVAASLALLCGVVCVACGGPSTDPTHGGAVAIDTVAGVERVTSRGATWSGGDAWTVRPTGLVIGEADGPDEYTFGGVGGVAVDDSGRVYVGDDHSHDIRMFSPTGEFLRRIGRAGEGPGEFRSIGGITPAPEGIAVLDGFRGRVSVFGADGRLVRSFRLERPYMIGSHFAPMRFDQRGRYYDRTPLSVRPLVDSIGVVRYSAAGEPEDTLLLDVVEDDPIMVEQDGRPMMSFSRPFSPRPSVAFGPDGRVYYARGDVYRITVLGPAGDTIREIRRPVEPRAVGREERDAAAAAIESRFREATGGPPPRPVEIPGTPPAIADLIVDAAGNLWVRPVPGPGSDRIGWSVHAPDGRYLGDVALQAMVVLQIGRDFVAGVGSDGMGVQRVMVYPLDRNGVAVGEGS